MRAPNTNPTNAREEDLNPGPPDYKSRALTTRLHCLHLFSGLLKEAGNQRISPAILNTAPVTLNVNRSFLSAILQIEIKWK